jgi:hypothetical protein
VDTPTFRLEKVSLELLMPQEDVNQAVSFSGDTKRDELGNSWALLSVRNPPKAFHYSEVFLVNVSAVRILSLPQSYEVPDELAVYLQSSESVQSDDPQIRALAASVTNGSSTDFERVAALAAWVHDNVVYDIRLRTETKDAVWVLENRMGVCDEFATLFIALARSVGIPARFVAGYYYGNGRWEEHAISEVYLGRWVPVDPTNLDVGRLDAAHLKLASSSGNVVGSRVRVSGADASKIMWETNTSIMVLNYTEGLGFDYNISVSGQDLSAGDSAVVILRMMPTEYALLRVDLEPCSSDFDFIRLDDKEKDVVLVPGREAVLYWRLSVSGNLKGNMLYTCPMVFNSRLLPQRSLNLSVQTAAKHEKPILKAELSDVEVGLGRNQTIFISLQDLPESEHAKVGVLADGYFQEFQLSGRQHLSVSLRPQHSGIQEIVVYSSTGSALALNYVVKEFSGVYVEGVELPELVRKDASAFARVFVKNGGSVRQDVKLYMSSGSSEVIRSLSVDDLSLAELPFSFDSVGVHRLVFRVAGGGFDAGTVRTVRVYDVPDVAVDSVYYPAERKAVVSLSVSKDAAENVRVVVGEDVLSASELFGRQDFVFNISEAAPVSVYYEDAFGIRYSVDAVLRIQEEGLLEAIMRFLAELIRSL